MTVGKYRRLLRSDPFRSANVSNSRLCVARRRHGFHNRSITFNGGLYDGNRFNGRCGLSANASSTTLPRCHGAWSISTTTRGYCPVG